MLRTRPKLFILLISEQFRTDYLDRLATSLTAGGFRHLMDEGSFYPDCRMAASSFTASGLATLLTGAYPELHGIVADNWYDRAARVPMPAHAEALLATTLAGRIASAPHNRVFALASEMANSSMLAGGAPAMVFAMDETGQFVAREKAPEWLAEYNRLHPIENIHNSKWMALGAGPDVPPLRTLTYNPACPEEFFALYRSSPFAQAAHFEFLRELIARERLGLGEGLDFLAVALAPLASLGYEVGADSPLIDQMVLNLDREIAFALGALNKLLGPGNYNLVFTAAHGAPRAPDAASRGRMAVSGEVLARSIERALSSRFDTPPVRNAYIEKYVYPFLYLRPAALRRNPRELRAAAAQAALADPAVAGYFTADGDCSYFGAWRERFQNSFHALRSGDVMLSYQPGYVEDYGEGRGISYGSLYNYDARVPLLLYGPQFRADVLEDTVEAVDLAPTLACCAGVEWPSSSTGQVLGDALAEAPKLKP